MKTKAKIAYTAIVVFLVLYTGLWLYGAGYSKGLKDEHVSVQVMDRFGSWSSLNLRGMTKGQKNLRLYCEDTKENVTPCLWGTERTSDGHKQILLLPYDQAPIDIPLHKE